MARSPIPIVFVTILHSGFADYVPASEEVRRNEWQKVQGRFRSISYQLPAEQMLELVAGALESGVPASLEQRWRVVDQSLSCVPFREASYKTALARHVLKCAPLHAITLALLWPLFRGKGAQNERSLFSFLTSNEPFGFQSFLEATDASGSETASIEYRGCMTISQLR